MGGWWERERKKGKKNTTEVISVCLRENNVTVNSSLFFSRKRQSEPLPEASDAGSQRGNRMMFVSVSSACVSTFTRLFMLCLHSLSTQLLANLQPHKPAIQHFSLLHNVLSVTSPSGFHFINNCWVLFHLLHDVLLYDSHLKLIVYCAVPYVEINFSPACYSSLTSPFHTIKSAVYGLLCCRKQLWCQLGCKLPVKIT